MSEPPQIVRASDEHAADAPIPGAVTISSSRASRKLAPPHSSKFLAATAALLGVAVVAVVAAVLILADGGSGGPAPQWSSWSPPDNGVAGEREIADEVAPFYRASPSTQLVIVTVQNVSTTGSGTSANGSGTSGGTQIAVRDPTNGTLSALTGSSAVYNLCGLGPSCAISAGTPSAARLLLLRREALELALYTFKYNGSVDNVVAILPPGRTTQSCTGICPKPPSTRSNKSTPLDIAVAFQRQGLQHFLDRPLRQTLPEQLPPTAGQMANAPEAELVSVITGQALFRQQVIQAQDGSNVLVLDPLPPQ
jgi:hypothetical protein